MSDAVTPPVEVQDTEVTKLQAQLWAARCEARDLKAKLEAATAKLEEVTAASAAATPDLEIAVNMSEIDASDDRDLKMFDAIDDNGDGVLSREEFTKGYALLMSDAASDAFDDIDDNGDGVLSREEFQNGLALLRTSDSVRAAQERAKIERAVMTERVRATKQAALIMAEAELMDVLYPSAPPRKWSDEAYAQYGPVPPGFDTKQVSRLVAERCAAKAARDFDAADRLQSQLVAMGVRVDDRWRTWSCAVTIQQAKDLRKTPYRRNKPWPSAAGSARGAGGGAGKRSGGGGGDRGGAARAAAAPRKNKQAPGGGSKGAVTRRRRSSVPGAAAGAATSAR